LAWGDCVPHGEERVSIERVALGDHENAWGAGHVGTLTVRIRRERNRANERFHPNFRIIVRVVNSLCDCARN
jgi:hypothetical protein